MTISVLVADDHAFIRELFRRVTALDYPDIEVVADTGDGEEAVRLAERLRPGVAVVDLRMGPIDGVEITRRVREHAPETRVLILSGYDDPGDVVAAMQAGAAGYVLKGRHIAQIVGALREVSGGGVVLDPTLVTALLSPTAEGDQREANVLAAREREVAVLVGAGLSDKEIAKRLSLSVRTVQAHVSRAMRKVGASGRAALAVYAERHKGGHGMQPDPPSGTDDPASTR